MPVRTITAEINGKVRKITADIPDGATEQDIMDAVASYKFDDAPAAPATPKQPEPPGFLSRAWDASGGAVASTVGEILRKGGPRVADEMAQGIVKRYLQNPQRTNNPFARGLDALIGPAIDTIAQDFQQGNVAGALGGIAGNAAMIALPSAVKGAQSQIAKVPARETVATMLRDSAAKDYGRVLNPTKQGTKYLSQKQVVPGLLDRNVVTPSLKSLKNKASAAAEELGAKIGDYWEAIPDDGLAPVNDILDNIRKEAVDTHTIAGPQGKRIPLGPDAKRALEASESLAKTIEEASVVDGRGVRQMPVKRLREMRQYFDDIAARAKRYQGADFAEQARAEIYGKTADAIRNEFAKADPNLNALNKEYSFWKNVEKVADETILRREGQARPLGRKIAEAAGTAAGATQGPVGALLGRYGFSMLESLTTSPAWRSLNAVTKNRLANALAKGKKGESMYFINRLKQEAGAATGPAAQSAQSAALTKQGREAQP